MAFWVYLEGLQVGLSDAFRVAHARGPSSSQSGPCFVMCAPPLCSELPCIAFLPQHMYGSPSGPIASLEMTSVSRIFVLFGFSNNVLVLPEEKGKRLSKRAGRPLFWAHKSGASTCPAFPPLLHHCPHC